MKKILNSEEFNPHFNIKKRGFVMETLFQGFIVILPLIIIIAIVSLILNFIFELVEPLSNLLELGKDEPRWWIKLLSVIIFLMIIFGIGLLARNRNGKKYFVVFERKYLHKIPLYTILLQTVNKFIGMKDIPFTQVVLLDPYKTGTLMTGFVTDKISEELYTIFVPTAPNPMNGNIYHAPKTSLTFLAVSSQIAMRTIMGMGTGSADMLVGMKTIESVSGEIKFEGSSEKNEKI
jgi:uncharacterized membrane protein